MVEIDLARCVVDVVVTANHQVDPHLQIVDDDREVVGRCTVATLDHQIVELGVGDFDRPPHTIDEMDRTRIRVAEADHRRAALRRIATIATVPVVARLVTSRDRLLAQALQPFLRAVAAVGPTLFQQSLDRRVIELKAIGLVVGPFVRHQFQPGQSVENGLHRLIGRTRPVGVFDPENELAAGGTRGQPAEQSRAGAANVQKSGRAGREPGTDWIGFGHFRQARRLPLTGAGCWKRESLAESRGSAD